MGVRLGPSLKQQIGFVERRLASDTYTVKAGVYLPNAFAVILFGIHCYGVTAPGHGYLGTKVGVRLGRLYYDFMPRLKQ